MISMRVSKAKRLVEITPDTFITSISRIVTLLMTTILLACAQTTSLPTWQSDMQCASNNAAFADEMARIYGTTGKPEQVEATKTLLATVSKRRDFYEQEVDCLKEMLLLDKTNVLTYSFYYRPHVQIDRLDTKSKQLIDKYFKR